VNEAEEEEQTADQGEEGEGEESEEEDEDKPRTPLDLTIRVVDASGEAADIPLSEVIRLLPPLKTTFMRLESLEDRFSSSSEATLQSIAVPLAWFVEINPHFTPGSIRQISGSTGLKRGSSFLMKWDSEPTGERGQPLSTGVGSIGIVLIKH